MELEKKYMNKKNWSRVLESEFVFCKLDENNIKGIASLTLIKKVKALIPMLIPLFISSFRRADDLAVAMEARCYQGGTNRTRLKQIHYKKCDLFARP
mgnify:CR=1 FL=1